MILLIDIGNTHTHVGLGTGTRVVRAHDLPTREVLAGRMAGRLRGLYPGASLSGAVMASVVPRATGLASRAVRQVVGCKPLLLSPRTLRGLAIDYPRPASIGQDRLANALAARQRFGAPVVVVDFGTAVTFDVVSGAGAYVGGIIAPGLSAMTDYLHEKTALLPRIRISEPRSPVGRSTREAMLVGAVHGYRGLVRQLIGELRPGGGDRGICGVDGPVVAGDWRGGSPPDVGGLAHPVGAAPPRAARARGIAATAGVQAPDLAGAFVPAKKTLTTPA